MLDSGSRLTSFIFVVFDILVGFGGKNMSLSRLLLLIHYLVSKVAAALWANTANAPCIPLSSSPPPYPFLIVFLSSVPIISQLSLFQLLLAYWCHRRLAGTGGVRSTMSSGGYHCLFEAEGLSWDDLLSGTCVGDGHQGLNKVSKRLLVLVQKSQKLRGTHLIQKETESNVTGWQVVPCQQPFIKCFMYSLSWQYWLCYLGNQHFWLYVFPSMDWIVWISSWWMIHTETIKCISVV
jgi:hypothetical protein